MRLAIEQAGAIVLRQRAAEVPVSDITSPAVQELIDLMLETVRGVGVGLAARRWGGRCASW